MISDKKLGSLDWFKLVAAILVVAIHTSPLISIDANADFLLTRILARVAVPFFFMVTGYFVLAPYVFREENDISSLMSFLKKTGKLYILAIIIYLPVNLYAGQLVSIGVSDLLRMLIFDGTFYHLWYLPASIIGAVIVVLLSRVFSNKAAFAVTIALYSAGLLGDSYYGFIDQVAGIQTIYEIMFNIFTYTRNGIFYAPVFLFMGALMKKTDSGAGHRRAVWPLVIVLAVMIAEGFVLHTLGVQRHDSMYISLIPCMWLLFQLLLSIKVAQKKLLRKMATWIYIIHPWCVVLVRGVAGVLGVEEYLVANSLIHFMMVCLMAIAFAAIVALISVGKHEVPSNESRAWVEVDLGNLRHNVEAIRKLLPDGCELMPAVKANAYGHGAVRIAQELEVIGVQAFCVASAAEGVELRKKGIKGTILVLGYTHPSGFSLLQQYDLTQTVVDKNYAEELASSGTKIKVHIKIDTGMHRLGERSENIEQICSIWEMKNLNITGIYTHLCCSDSLDNTAVEYTYNQISSFNDVLAELDKRNLLYGKVHVLASYGVLNYPDHARDYARVGIALYGVLSKKEDMDNCPLPLHPVLELKARVASVKHICSGECVGYGMAYTADADRKIAVLSIGYADGIPRELSCGQGAVLINGEYAPIVGRVCMDQMIVDVTAVPDIKCGDIATIIGKDVDNEITVYDVAGACGTITNEVLSRLGGRLDYKYKSS